MSVVQFIADEESDDDWGSEVGFEERLNVWLTADREECDVELGNETKNVEAETDPGADDAEHCCEGQVVGRAAVHGPGFAEADVREADTAPGKEVGEAGDGEQPGEDGASVLGFVDVGQAAEEKGYDEHNVRATLGVYTRADGGTHTTSAKSLDCSRGGESARVGDRQD